MSEVKIIRPDEELPEFKIDEVKARREARRKERAKKEGGLHHVELRRPQGEVRLFSMDPGMTHYYGVDVDISSVPIKEVMLACGKAFAGNIGQVEMIVVRFKDKVLAFEPQDGREL